MSILITGGAGYIGSHVNRLLTEKYHERTIILDDLSTGHIESVLWGKFYKGNFGDKILLRQIFKENNIEAIMHFAAFASVPDSVINPLKYYQNNVNNLINILEIAKEYNVKYFIFSSSAATFGDPQINIINENTLQNPINPYGFTKLIGEHILKDFELAYGLKYCIFRYFCAAGDSKDSLIGEAHFPETHLIPLAIKAGLTQQDFYIYGNQYPTKDGSGIRDFIHVEDIAEAHYLGLQYLRNNNISNDFNLGTEKGYSVKEIIAQIPLKVKTIISAPRKGDPAILIASNQKAQKILRWIPQNNLNDIIQDALNWELKRTY